MISSKLIHGSVDAVKQGEFLKGLQAAKGVAIKVSHDDPIMDMCKYQVDSFVQIQYPKIYAPLLATKKNGVYSEVTVHGRGRRFYLKGLGLRIGKQP